MTRQELLALISKGADIGAKGAIQQNQLQAIKEMQADKLAAQAPLLQAQQQQRAATQQLQQDYRDQLNRERQEKAVSEFGKRLEKSQQPALLGALADLEKATSSAGKGGVFTNPQAKIPTSAVANLTRKIPFVGPLINQGLEGVGAIPKGTEKTWQAVQRLLNIESRQMSGTAVTVFEQARQEIEKGVLSGDADALKRGMKMVEQAYELNTKNIAASTRPEAVKEFKARGGKLELSDLLGLSPKAPAPKVAPPPAPLDQARALSPEQRRARIKELQSRRK